MSDFNEIQITLNRAEPFKSKIEIDGQPITNVYAIRLEQKSPTDTLELELCTYGSEPMLIMNGNWIIRAFCPRCKQSTGTGIWGQADG